MITEPDMHWRSWHSELSVCGTSVSSNTVTMCPPLSQACLKQSVSSLSETKVPSAANVFTHFPSTHETDVHASAPVHSSAVMHSGGVPVVVVVVVLPPVPDPPVLSVLVVV